MVFVKLVAGTVLLAGLGYLWFEATGIRLSKVLLGLVWLGMVVVIIRRHEAKHPARDWDL
jgi:hypothetical protein